MAQTINSTAILIEWGEVPEDQRNGEIISYEIWIIPAQFQEPTFMNVSSPTQMAVIGNLEEFVNYTFAIRAYTAAGPGPFSINITNITDTAGC